MLSKTDRFRKTNHLTLSLVIYATLDRRIGVHLYFFYIKKIIFMSFSFIINIHLKISTEKRPKRGLQNVK